MLPFSLVPLTTPFPNPDIATVNRGKIAVKHSLKANSLVISFKYFMCRVFDELA